MNAADARHSLKTHNIVFLVIAAAAPLTVVSAGATAAYATSGMAGVPLGYVVCGVLVAFFAVGFCAMAREIPNTAAFFSYVSAGLGRSHGLAASWLALISYLAMQVALYSLFGFTVNGLLLNQFGLNIPWWVCTLGAIGLVAILGVKSADFASRILGVLLTLEFLAVALYCVVALSNPADTIGVRTLSLQAFVGAGTGTMLAFTIAGFMGIESTAMYSEETHKPEKTIPRATLIAVAVISVFYAFSSWSIAQSMGEGNIVEEAQAQGADLFFNFLAANGFGGVVPLIRVLLATSLFAAVTSFHNTISRYLMALGRERVIWSQLGQTTPGGAPISASLFLSAFGAAVVLGCAGLQYLIQYGEAFPADIIFSWMSAAGGFGLVFLFLVTSLSVIRYFKQRPNTYRKLTTVIAPGIAVLGFGVVFVLILLNFNVLVGNDELWYLVVVVPGLILLCGVAGFLRGEYLRKNSPDIYRNIGSGKAPDRSEDRVEIEHGTPV